MGSRGLATSSPGRAQTRPSEEAALLVLVVVMVTVQALHDFWLGPAAGRTEPGTPRARTLRRWASWLARGNAVLGVALPWVAVRLARGG